MDLSKFPFLNLHWLDTLRENHRKSAKNKQLYLTRVPTSRMYFLRILGSSRRFSSSFNCPGNQLQHAGVNPITGGNTVNGSTTSYHPDSPNKGSCAIPLLSLSMQCKFLQAFFSPPIALVYAPLLPLRTLLLKAPQGFQKAPQNVQRHHQRYKFCNGPAHHIWMSC